MIDQAGKVLTLGIEVLDTNAGGNGSHLHSQAHLHDTGHGAGSLGMTDIGLDGADEKRLSLAVLEEHVGDTLQLDWVTDGSSSTVALKVGSLIRVQVASKGIGLADDLFLANGTGLGDATGLTIGVGGGTANDTTDWVTIANGVREPLQV